MVKFSIYLNKRVFVMSIYRVLQIPSIETHTLDLSDWDATRTLVQSLGPIDLLVNNAGIIKVTPFLEVSKEEVDT